MTRTCSLSIRALAVLLGAWVLSACGGTSTGNPLDDVDAGGKHTPDGGGGLTTGNEGGYSQCDAKSSTLATLDTKSTLGFSANDVLALVGSTQTLSMEWLAGGSFQLTPAPGKSTLHIAVTAKDAKPRFVQLDEKAGGGSGGLIDLAPVGDPCPDHIELDVHVTLKSDDGGLDEAFDTTLLATSTRQVSYTHTIKAAALGGSFDVTSMGTLGTFMLDSVQLETSFSKLGVSGSLVPTLVSDTKSASSESTGAGGVATAGGAAARWPAGAACDASSLFGNRGLPRALADAFGNASMQDAIKLANDAGTLKLAWQHASATTLHVSFAPNAGDACARYGVAQLGEATDLVQLSIAGKLSAKSDDGRVGASWPLTLTAYFDADDELEHVAAVTDPNGGIVAGLVASKDFASTYGIDGIDVSAYDEANALLSVSWNAVAPITADGTLIVRAADVPECAMQQPVPVPPADSGIGSSSSGGGSAGCAGLDLHELEVATLTSE